ncbi:MAG: hypothetical protein ACXVB9_15435 [Bdellovibrionota bacterium]
MKTLLLFLVVLAPLAAQAKDINACNTVGAALNTTRDEDDRAQFALRNEDYLCSDQPDKAACEAGIEERAKKTAGWLADMEKNYRDMGCED